MDAWVGMGCGWGGCNGWMENLVMVKMTTIEKRCKIPSYYNFFFQSLLYQVHTYDGNVTKTRRTIELKLKTKGSTPINDLETYFIIIENQN